MELSKTEFIRWFVDELFRFAKDVIKKNKQEFSVVFRTFGQDLKAVAHEFDKFAKGDHPCFNGRNGMPLVKMDGAKASKDFRFKNPN